jgi:hypothetical protein
MPIEASAPRFAESRLPELLQRPVGWLASGVVFTLLGAVGLLPGPGKPRAWREVAIHPIRYRIRNSEAIGRVIAPLALVGSYLYIWGIVDGIP